MAKGWIDCWICGKSFLKDYRHINENKKLGYKFYCSIQCQLLAKSKKVEFICANTICNKKFKRQISDISQNNYCSRSCAAVVNNTRFPKRIVVKRRCKYCRIEMLKYRIYCSVRCKAKDKTISGEEIVEQIRGFYKKYGRIPLKREFHHYNAARDRFGNWNHAIEVAGFKPNPIMFADRCIANDGHICDSMAEKVIDDYLYEKGILHERNVFYPVGDYTFDFKIGNIFVEYFGLAGEHKRYDELRKIKQRIIKNFNLQFLAIYPHDLYPHNKLADILVI